MTSITSARNTTQRAGDVNRVQGRFTNANTGIYTVPAGKRTRVTDILGIVDTLGSDATYSIAIKVFTTGLFKAITVPQGVGVTQTASQITLEEGDKLTDIGDSGSTNAAFELSATIEEFST